LRVIIDSKNCLFFLKTAMVWQEKKTF
jgi:hypothetical protein